MSQISKRELVVELRPRHTLGNRSARPCILDELAAGAGCNAWGWDRARRAGRMTGMGWRMGEAASAGEVVDEAIRWFAKDWSMRGSPTRLTQAFVAFTGARDAEDLLEGVTLERYAVDAGAAPIVFRVAAEGDPVARRVVEWAGRDLDGLANGVIRQLGFEALRFHIVLVGSLQPAIAHNRADGEYLVVGYTSCGIRVLT